DTTPLRLLRDKRLVVVLVRLRALTHRRLPSRVTNVVGGVDGGGDVLRRAAGGLVPTELLDQHAENVTVVDQALVVVPDVRHTEILAADVDTAIGALPVRGNTGRLIAGVGRAGPGRVTVILRRPGRRALRVVTTSTTRGRSRCTGVDAGVVGRTRATATRGRGTAGTASATSAALRRRHRRHRQRRPPRPARRRHPPPPPRSSPPSRRPRRSPPWRSCSLSFRRHFHRST